MTILTKIRFIILRYKISYVLLIISYVKLFNKMVSDMRFIKDKILIKFSLKWIMDCDTEK